MNEQQPINLNLQNPTNQPPQSVPESIPASTTQAVWQPAPSEQIATKGWKDWWIFKWLIQKVSQFFSKNKQKSSLTDKAEPSKSFFINLFKKFTTTKKKEEKPKESFTDLSWVKPAVKPSDELKKYTSKLVTHKVITIAWIIIFWLTSLLFFIMRQFMHIASQKVIDPTFTPYVQMYKDYEKDINEYVSLNEFDYYKNLSLLWAPAKPNLRQIVDASTINYVHKKDIIQAWVDQISQSIISQHQQLDAIKRDIAAFWFFSKELFELVDADKQTTSIQRSLLSLETIKFATALKIFKNLDTFIDQFSRNFRVDKEFVREQMDFFLTRWEADISTYIQSCYLNPLEDVRKCNIVNDFEKYFTFVETETEFDAELFKALISFIDNKLEDTDYPSLEIQFDNFNPSSQSLSFTIEVNSFQEDEIELFRKGILNPHIFIITNMINLLKQSRFVIGESIRVDKLNINRNEVKIWSTSVFVSTSQMKFTLPLQKETQREIFDYVFETELGGGQLAIDDLTSEDLLELDTITTTWDNELSSINSWVILTTWAVITGELATWATIFIPRQ